MEQTLTDILMDSRDTSIIYSPTPTIDELHEVLCRCVLVGSKKLTHSMVSTLRNSIVNFITNKLKYNASTLEKNRLIVILRETLSPVLSSLSSRASKVGSSASDLLLILRPLKFNFEGNKICLIDLYAQTNLNKLAEHLFNIDQRVRKNMVALLDKFQNEVIDEIPLFLIYRNLSRSDPSPIVRKEVVKRLLLSESSCCIENKVTEKHIPNSSFNCLMVAVNDDNLSVRIAVMNRINEITLKHLSLPRRINLLKRCFTERGFDAKTQLINSIQLEYTIPEIVEDFCEVSIEYIEKLTTNHSSQKINKRNFDDSIRVILPDLIYSSTTKQLIELLYEIFPEMNYQLPTTTDFKDLFLLRVYNEYLQSNDRPQILPDPENMCKEVINICQVEGIEDSQDFILKTLRTLELFRIAHFYNSYDSEAKTNLLKSVRQLLAHHCQIFADKKCPNKLQLYSNFIYLLFTHAVSLLYKWDSSKIIMQVIAKFISTSSYNTALLNLYKVILEINKFYETSNNEEIQQLSSAVYNEGVRPFLEKKIQLQKKIDFTQKIVQKELFYGLKSMQKYIKVPLAEVPISTELEIDETISNTNKKINYNLLLHNYFLYEPTDYTILPITYKTDLFLKGQLALSDYKKFFNFESQNIQCACKVLMKVALTGLLPDKAENMDFIYALLHFILDKYFGASEDGKNTIHVFLFEYLKISNYHLHILPIYTHFLETNKKIVSFNKKNMQTFLDFMMTYSGVLNTLLFYMTYWSYHESALKETIERSLVFLEKYELCNKNSHINIDKLETMLPEKTEKSSYIEKIEILEILLDAPDSLKIKILQILSTKLIRKIKDQGFSKLYFQISKLDDGHVSEKLTKLVTDYLE
ncbi:hypothetical protein CDIK_2041 [Cucumispora dikerogammari]|nr:hypothetical protein CDIK_2041 [Cucumispora dikerogammari]